MKIKVASLFEKMKESEDRANFLLTLAKVIGSDPQLNNELTKKVSKSTSMGSLSVSDMLYRSKDTVNHYRDGIEHVLNSSEIDV